MARISNRSALVVPMGVAAAALISVLGYLVNRAHAVDIDNAVRDTERTATSHTIDTILPKLDAIPRIQTDVEWIRAELQRRASGNQTPSDQAKR